MYLCVFKVRGEICPPHLVLCPFPHNSDSGWDPLTVSPWGRPPSDLGGQNQLYSSFFPPRKHLHESHFSDPVSKLHFPSFLLFFLHNAQPNPSPPPWGPLSGPRNNSPPFPMLLGGKRYKVINLRWCTVEKIKWRRREGEPGGSALLPVCSAQQKWRTVHS